MAEPPPSQPMNRHQRQCAESIRDRVRDMKAAYVGIIRAAKIQETARRDVGAEHNGGGGGDDAEDFDVDDDDEAPATSRTPQVSAKNLRSVLPVATAKLLHASEDLLQIITTLKLAAVTGNLEEVSQEVAAHDAANVRKCASVAAELSALDVDIRNCARDAARQASRR